MDSGLVAQLVVYMVVLLLAVSAHEAAHAWMSYRFGDDTARLLGRITLNPVMHIDPIGTLLLPIAGFIIAHMGGGIALIGWGKPTPVNPLRWRNKDVANVMVSIAGILANLTLASMALVAIKVIQYTHVLGEAAALGSIAEGLWTFLLTSVYLNVGLAVFNLIPIPPLDGSKILYTILPADMHATLETLERFGFIILLVVVQTGILNVIFSPFMNIINFLVRL